MSPLQLLLLGLLSLVLCVLRGRKRRKDEPPLINGWIPFIGKALEFGRDAHKFLGEQKKKFGDVFTVHIAGKYMTFIMDPLLYPNIIKHGRQLDFHQWSDKFVPFIFGYPPVMSKNLPGLHNEILRCFQLLQGDHLGSLTEGMIENLMLVLRQDHIGETPRVEVGWRSGSMYHFCNVVMFEATFLTIYGWPALGRRHSDMDRLRENFGRFDGVFPLLIAQFPIWLLRQAKASRDVMNSYFLSHMMSRRLNTCKFIKKRDELLNQYDSLSDSNKAAHHVAVLWASVANTVPATFWALYYLVMHPEALQVVRQEIHDVLKLSGVEFSTDTDVRISREHLEKLLYLESTINESLRLSSASMNIRVAQEDFSMRLDDQRSVAIRNGDIIALYPQSVHMDPEIYEEPQTFRFDRYIQDGREKTDFFKNGQKLKHYLMPFGSGSTMCPGRYFAINEIKQFLCLLLLYFDLQLEDGQTRATVNTGRAGLGILLPSTDVRFRYRLRTV